MAYELCSDWLVCLRIRRDWTLSVCPPCYPLQSVCPGVAAPAVATAVWCNSTFTAVCCPHTHHPTVGLCVCVCVRGLESYWLHFPVLFGFCVHSPLRVQTIIFTFAFIIVFSAHTHTHTWQCVSVMISGRRGALCWHTLSSAGRADLGNFPTGALGALTIALPGSLLSVTHEIPEQVCTHTLIWTQRLACVHAACSSAHYEGVKDRWALQYRVEETVISLHVVSTHLDYSSESDVNLYYSRYHQKSCDSTARASCFRSLVKNTYLIIHGLLNYHQLFS